MLAKNTKNYLLTIKRDNNDYLPLEWHLTEPYEGENLLSLEGIDSFTSKLSRVELLSEVLKANMIGPTEKYHSFAIIYFEKGKNRELKEGTIFKEDNIPTENEIILFILENIQNKAVLNDLYNACNIKIQEQKLEEFKFILKNISLFQAKGNNAVIAAISTFSDLSYETKRIIIMRIAKKVLPKYIELSSSNYQMKKEYRENEGKVA